MDYTTLGTSSLKVSRIALGAMGIGSPEWRSWVGDAKAALPIVARAVESGINLIDTCDFYSAGESERVIGACLRDLGARDMVMVATKCGNPMGRGPNQRGYSRKHIVEAAEASLRRLDTDHIDLFQTHIWDPATNIEEMVAAFDQLVRQGKVLYVGATDVPCWQLAKAVYYARGAGFTSFATLQHHYNAVWREDERDLIPFCRAEGIGLLPYSPVARGFLAGSDRRHLRNTERARTDDYAWSWYGRPEDEAVARAVDDVAARIDAEPAQVALAWVMKRSPGAIPIVGPTKVEQLDALLGALALELDADACLAIESAYLPRRAGGHF